MAATIPMLCIRHVKFLQPLNSRLLRGIGGTGQFLEDMKTLKERLKELNVPDPELDKPIDIGLPKPPSLEPSYREYCKHIRNQKLNKDLELASRHRKLKLPIEEVRRIWEKTSGPYHIKEVAEHYGIYRDLFDNAHFYPWVPLHVKYKYDEEQVMPVFRGNHIKPSEAAEAPDVEYEATPNSFWTLILTNPDCHYEDNSAEYLHWFVGNIPGNDIKKGEIVCDYMQPFPAKGTGYHRFIFVLYKQDQKINFDKLKRPSPCHSLQERTFQTFDFYKSHQDVLTPAGLAFFQSDWDETLGLFFHETLNMQEPIFEYDYPAPYLAPEVWVPSDEQPFDEYLDAYRDPKEIAKEVLLMRLKRLDPFQPEPEPPKFPLAFPIPKELPDWYKKHIRWQRLRIKKYKDL